MRKNKQQIKLFSVLLIFLLVIVIGLKIGFVHETSISIKIVDDQLTKQGYSKDEIEKIKSSLEVDQILELSTQSYTRYALERYDVPHFKELMALGYTGQEAKALSSLPIEVLVLILKEEHIDQILDFLQTDYFIVSRLPRYLDTVQLFPNEDLRKIVEIVNTDRDYDAYTHTVAVDFSQELILVNKYHSLLSSYVPSNLVQAEGCGKPKMVSEAALAYDLMCEAIMKAGIGLSQRSAYRSYSSQKSIYTRYLKYYSQEYTDTFSARPGFSEHQTGLAVDVFSTNASFATFEETDAYTWLKQNAYKYGFIVRYPKGKEAITGYKFESWHYRYVGTEVSQKITELGITLDEYWLWLQE
jgi:LAS superfamily LD-carboxypeptidase LdcB